jgi:hypothetical protein
VVGGFICDYLYEGNEIWVHSLVNLSVWYK